jgi:hypothetical protein
MMTIWLTMFYGDLGLFGLRHWGWDFLGPLSLPVSAQYKPNAENTSPGIFRVLCLGQPLLIMIYFPMAGYWLGWEVLL